jgi:hypothetical protein
MGAVEGEYLPRYAKRVGDVRLSKSINASQVLELITPVAGKFLDL